MFNKASDYYNQMNNQNMLTNSPSLQDYVNMTQARAYREESTKEKHARLTRELAELEEMMLDEPLNGPTRRELRAHESLHNAWHEMMTVWKLVGKK